MQTYVIENLSPIDCLKRSWIITKGNVLLIFVTAIILGIISIIISIPFIITSRVGVLFISTIGSFLSFIIMGPLNVIVFTLLYLILTRKTTTKVAYPYYQNPYQINQPPNYKQ